MRTQFFLQMSGVPGTGKTTIANIIAKKTGAIVVDHDVAKSALLDSTVPGPLANKASYKVLQGFASHLMAQGHSVIFDSACYYDAQLEYGQKMTRYYKAKYLYIECCLNDLGEIDQRLRNRKRFPSQLSSVWAEFENGTGEEATGEDLFKIWMKNMKRPDKDYLILDTSLPLLSSQKKALNYVRHMLRPKTAAQPRVREVEHRIEPKPNGRSRQPLDGIIHSSPLVKAPTIS